MKGNKNIVAYLRKTYPESNKQKIELKTIKISFASDSRISGSLTLAL